MFDMTQVKIGDELRTREGEKVTVKVVDAPGKFPYIVTTLFSYTKDGFFMNESLPDKADIVGYWTEESSSIQTDTVYGPFETEELAKQFLVECTNLGYLWSNFCSGKPPSVYTNWQVYFEDTCYRLEKKEIKFYNTQNYIQEGYQIVKWEPQTKTITLEDTVNHPAHYNNGKIEVIDYIEDKGFCFCLANAVKYISRAGKKNKDKEIEDLDKAIFYLNRKIKQLREAG